ncbi:MAG: DegT/DnrJ/EryC1/StrS family aminotransferase [Ferruginibacter sp.]
MINVTKTYLPPFEEYTALLKRAWDKGWITNSGDLAQELERKLKDYLAVENLLFTCNGTIVLQMALKVLNITKEVITTPFSYVATTNVILWEGCTPVFVDIDPLSLCIDAAKIEAAITADTEAILATHVYGIPCDIEAIDAIAKKYNLKVIYDAAHAFGCTYKDKSLLSYGDISTCSFHATKVFHTGEGGCIIANDAEISGQLYLQRGFGHIGDDYFCVGINAKSSEMHAAMGLCVLPKVQEIIKGREIIFNLYSSLLNLEKIQLPVFDRNLQYNYAYYPVVFQAGEVLEKVRAQLLKQGISTRRYFYPSLNQLPFIDKMQSCPVSEDVSKRVLSLPLFADLPEADVCRIANVINAIV